MSCIKWRNNQGNKKTGMNLQNMPLTYRITDKQVKNTTTYR